MTVHTQPYPPTGKEMDGQTGGQKGFDIFMKAVIIAASAGAHLRPLTCDRPVHNLPVVGKPLIHYTQDLCLAHGLEDIFVLEEDIARELAALSKTDSLMILDSDVLFDVDLGALAALHARSKASFSRVYFPGSLDEQYCGIQIADHGVLDEAAAQSLVDGKPDLPYGRIEYDCYAKRLDTIDDYLACHRDLLSKKPNLLPPDCEVRDGLWIEDSANIEKGVKIETPAYICAGAVVERGASIGSYSVIGQNCILKPQSDVKLGVLLDNAEIGVSGTVRKAVIGSHVKLGQKAEVFENSCIGSRSVIEPNSTVFPGLKVWPNKRIAEGSRVHENLVWGSVFTQRLFSERGISGEINVEITPEFAAKLGAALGSMLRWSRIALSHDMSPACEMLMAALEAGLKSTGAQVYLFGEQSLPITRSGILYYRLDGGVHLNMIKVDDEYYPEIEFIDSKGITFDFEQKKQLEDIFADEDLVRCEPIDIAAAVRLDNYKFYYAQEILNSLKSRNFHFNMEVRTKSETVSELLELLLSEIEKLVGERNEKKEFWAEISENGESLTLFTSDGRQLSQEQCFAVMAMVLLNNTDCRNIVLPVTSSDALKTMIELNGGNVILSGASAAEFMKQILAKGSSEQFRLCFDGIYAAIAILDYLNRHKVSFDRLIEKIPQIHKQEEEITCPEDKKGLVISGIIEKYKDTQARVADGVKIYHNDGWVLILPEKSRHYIKIITEGISTETAKELSADAIREVRQRLDGCRA